MMSASALVMGLKQGLVKPVPNLIKTSPNKTDAETEAARN